jgi:excisionase family DNA binding protein
MREVEEDQQMGEPGIIADISASTERFIDAEEASRFLGGLNSRTVVRWAREGYLPAYPIGEGKRRLWRFLEADLEAWMLARRSDGRGFAAGLHSGQPSVSRSGDV